MTFKELQPNYLVYYLDKAEPKYYEAKVVSMSQPRFENKLGQAAQMVQDLTLDNNGCKTTYVVPENASRVYGSNFVLSTNKEDIIAEVRAIRNSSESVIKSIEHHKSLLQKCDDLLNTLDSSFKEKKEYETRFSKLEDCLQKLTQVVSDISKKQRN